MKKTIWDMVDKEEKVTIPKLMQKTGLSRGFFYKNNVIRGELDRALECLGWDDRSEKEHHQPCHGSADPAVAETDRRTEAED